jgi:hypothetical protein
MCSALLDTEPKASKVGNREGELWQQSVDLDLNCWTRTWRRLRAVAGSLVLIECYAHRSLRTEEEPQAAEESKKIMRRGYV